VKSATRESGKTRVLEILQWLVAKPWFTARVSAAVMIRKIDAEMPTLLLDESDAAFSGDPEYTEALRGALNAGYRRGGCHSMCVGTSANLKPKDFSVFGPKAIAGIGRLPDTVAGRSIPIVMKRRRADERHVQRYREREVKGAAEPYRQQLAGWAPSAIPVLRAARPEMPTGFRDRAEDVLEPLFAIADLAGDLWPARVRRAAVNLMGTPEAGNEAIGVRLLADLRSIFNESGSDAMHTKDLLQGLINIEEAPWADWRHGRPITGKAFANILQDYEIQSAGTVRIGDKTFKGYRKAAFEDAWARYLTSDPSFGNKPNNDGPKPAVWTRHSTECVTDAKSRVSSTNTEVCYGVTDGTPLERTREEGAQMAFSELVTLRDGFVVDWAVVRRLLEIESRGCSFRLENGGRFRVLPVAQLRPDDVQFLRERRDEARRVIEDGEQMAQQSC
jgi:hypothetical protein